MYIPVQTDLRNNVITRTDNVVTINHYIIRMLL